MSAAAMTSISRIRVASGIFHYHAFQDVGGVLALVGGPLQGLVDLFPFDQLDRVFLLVEQAADRLPADAVSLVLQRVHLDAAFADMLEFAAKQRDPLVDDLARLEDEERQLFR